MFRNLIPSTFTRAILAVFLFIAGVLPSQALQSGDFMYGGGPGIYIVGYTGAGGAVIIPSSINGYSVTWITDSAFSGKTNLTSVLIPNSVTTIGSSAFQGCTGLTSVTIGSGVTSIGSLAFYDCKGLTSVTVDAANPNYSDVAGVLFNKNQTSLIQYPGGKTGSYTIPSSVTSIGPSAFSRCTGLTSVTIVSGVTNIGDSAFAACTGMTSATIPNSVTSIGNNAFAVCSGLTSVAIPNSVTTIGSLAFYDCKGLTSVTVDAANPNYSSMAGVLFNKNQTSLIQYPGGKTGSYTIPSSVTSIGPSAFYACSGLTSVTIGSGVTNIGDSAFAACTGMTSATIGNSVNSIGSNAFSGCSSLTSMSIPNSVTSIGSSAFQSCTGMTSATIGNSVNSIGSSAFQSCTGLTSATIGNSVNSIETSAFLTCPNLLSIYIKGNAPALGATVFTSNSKSNVYYRSGTTGWTSTYGGLSTVALGLPTITGQPSSVIANAGENAAFSAIAKTTFPLTLSYQWQRNGLIIPGATAESLYLSSIQSANVGTYTVIISNDIGSVSSAVTLTLTQGNLYTQAQFDSAIKTGYDLGVSSGGGNADVLANPNNYGLYSLTQVQTLNVGTPLLVKNPTTGNFKLTVGVEKSTNLVNFTPMPIPGSAVINAQGKMEFEFTSTDNAAFFRVGSK